MSRPVKFRRVASMPEVAYFKPSGVPHHLLGSLRLSVEEAEAIRLKDLDGLEQEQCAERMNISRTTFQRVLHSARQKVADALLNGKTIKIEGGNFEMATHRFRCIEGHEWNVPFEIVETEPPQSCPACSTTTITSIQPAEINKFGQKQWREHSKKEHS